MNLWWLVALFAYVLFFFRWLPQHAEVSNGNHYDGWIAFFYPVLQVTYWTKMLILSSPLLPFSLHCNWRGRFFIRLDRVVKVVL